MTELTLDVVGSALFGRGMADLARQDRAAASRSGSVPRSGRRG